MRMNSVRTGDGSDDSIRFKPMERLKVYLFGATVLFAWAGVRLLVITSVLAHLTAIRALPTEHCVIIVLLPVSEFPQGSVFVGSQCLRTFFGIGTDRSKQNTMTKVGKVQCEYRKCEINYSGGRDSRYASHTRRYRLSTARTFRSFWAFIAV